MTQKYSDTTPHCPEDNHPRKNSTVTTEVEKKRKSKSQAKPAVGITLAPASKYTLAELQSLSAEKIKEIHTKLGLDKPAIKRNDKESNMRRIVAAN